MEHLYGSLAFNPAKQSEFEDVKFKQLSKLTLDTYQKWQQKWHQKWKNMATFKPNGQKPGVYTYGEVRQTRIWFPKPYPEKSLIFL